MSDDIEKIRKELEDVRRLKEELASEIEDVRHEKERLESRREARDHRREREDLDRERERIRRGRRIVRPRPPPPVRVPEIDIDLTKVTESLEDMMDGLGEQIEMSMRHLDGTRIPGIRLSKTRRKGKASKARKFEDIPPERVAKIVSPLGSEERLKIIDLLKTGGKKFNELEQHTGKTGSSLTHHLDPLLEAGYVVKGEVRGTYYATVEGRLAYRLAQWLTSRVERQQQKSGNGVDKKGADVEAEDVDVEFESDEEEDTPEEREGHNYAYRYDAEDSESEIKAGDDLDDMDWKD